jgi:hypothetical protein
VPAGEEEVLASVWQRHRQWSVLADRLKRRITWSRTIALVLSAAGALLQTLSASLKGGHLSGPLAAVGAAALVLVPFMGRNFLSPEQVRGWLRARSASEGLKSLVFRFQASAAPFDGADRAQKLDKTSKELESWTAALANELATVPTDGVKPPRTLKPELYLSDRVAQQIDEYYRPKARTNAKRATLFRWLELGMAAAAAVLGTIAAALQFGSQKGGPAAWAAVLTTIGGAFASHAAASRYEQQARTYFATARQLEDLRRERDADPNSGSPAAWTAFVSACEDVISAENRGWMAKLDPEEKSQASP